MSNEQVQAGQPTDTAGQQTAEKTTVSTPDLDKMSEKELRELASAALEAKRAANSEAKQYREKLQVIEGEKQKAAEAELSYKERFEKLKGEYDGYKTKVHRDNLSSQFIAKAVEAGLPAKIAKLSAATLADLAEDNLDAKVKDAVKEFADFMPKEEKKPAPAIHNPFAAAQPIKPEVKSKIDGSHSAVAEEVERIRQGKRA